MKITKEITLDFAGGNPGMPVMAKQGDDGSRFVLITLTDNGGSCAIPQGATAEFRCVKPDGRSCLNPAVINADGTITVELTQQVLAVPGTVWADVTLKGEAGEILSTVSFRIWVCAAPLGKAIESDNEFLRLVELVEQGRSLMEVLGDEESGYVPRLLALEREMDTARQQIGDLMYEEITVSSLTLDRYYAEVGSTVESVKMQWSLNKEPVSQSVNGGALDTGVRELVFTDVNTSTTYTLVVTDERDVSVARGVRLNFVNGVYLGVLARGAALDSAAVLGLQRKLQSGRTVTFTVEAGEGEQIAFALPRSFGTPVFSVGGFDGGFYLGGSMDFTNASGYTEEYDVWLSDEAGLGKTTVAVT